MVSDPSENEPPSHSVLAVVLQVRDGRLRCSSGSAPSLRGRLVAPGRELEPRRVARGVDPAAPAAKVDVRELSHLEQLETRSDPGRNPLRWELATAYLGLVPSDLDPEVPSDTSWHPVDKLPPLAFDHRPIILAARERLRAKLSYTNIGFALAPRAFTISELRDLYLGGSRPRRLGHQPPPDPAPPRASRDHRRPPRPGPRRRPARRPLPVPRPHSRHHRSVRDSQAAAHRQLNRGIDRRRRACFDGISSSSSSALPAPRATVVSGSSSIVTWRPVSRRISSSKPRISAPPPTSVTPRVGDVGRELGRRSLEQVLDRVHDLGERRLEGAADALGVEARPSQEPGAEVAAGDLAGAAPARCAGDRAADLDLQPLGLLLADQELLVLLRRRGRSRRRARSRRPGSSGPRRGRRVRSPRSRSCRRRCRGSASRPTRRPAGPRRSRPRAARRSARRARLRQRASPARPRSARPA